MRNRNIRNDFRCGKCGKMVTLKEVRDGKAFEWIDGDHRGDPIPNLRDVRRREHGTLEHCWEEGC